ncbi:MAG: F0F1 ATP synthase subunit B [Gammaproteobacteria bacterium]|nr:MAG: F0F1 ATP synthase subunit B [Gammaproteobacteria bacterium]
MNINLTLLLEMITFAVFVWFTMKFVWTPIIGALETRKNEIADGLAAAQRGEKEQELAQQKATEVIKEAKQQAAEILGHAKKRGDEMVDEAKQAALEEAAHVKAAAEAEIERDANRAKETLRKEVGKLAARGAAKILNKEVDAKSHARLLEELAAEL